MRHLIFLIMSLLTCGALKAQQTAVDYIYSSDGFEVKKTIKEEIVHTDGSWPSTGDTKIYKYESVGLYSKDGKVLVAAIRCQNSEFYVIDGCETICSGAFQAFENIKIFIPSTIINIAPDAIKAHHGYTKTNTFGGIVDGMKEVPMQQSATGSPIKDVDPTEVARYNLQGIRLNRPVNGVNIVHMSDGTTTKQLIQ